jgi:hypothetical protein
MAKVASAIATTIAAVRFLDFIVRCISLALSDRRSHNLCQLFDDKLDLIVT